MAFNECTFGFVPHSGATYYLSRLPHEFGTFLALTGISIHGTDAAKLKLVDTIMQTTKFVHEDVADVIYSQGYDPREFHKIHAQHEERVKKGEGHFSSARYLAQKARLESNSALDKHAADKAFI